MVVPLSWLKRTPGEIAASRRCHGACNASFRCAAFSGCAALRGKRRASSLRPSLAVFVNIALRSGPLGFLPRACLHPLTRVQQRCSADFV